MHEYYHDFVCSVWTFAFFELVTHGVNDVDVYDVTHLSLLLLLTAKRGGDGHPLLCIPKAFLSKTEIFPSWISLFVPNIFLIFPHWISERLHLLPHLSLIPSYHHIWDHHLWAIISLVLTWPLDILDLQNRFLRYRQFKSVSDGHSAPKDKKGQDMLIIRELTTRARLNLKSP